MLTRSRLHDVHRTERRVVVLSDRPHPRDFARVSELTLETEDRSARRHRDREADRLGEELAELEPDTRGDALERPLQVLLHRVGLLIIPAEEVLREVTVPLLEDLTEDAVVASGFPEVHDRVGIPAVAGHNVRKRIPYVRLHLTATELVAERLVHRRLHELPYVPHDPSSIRPSRRERPVRHGRRGNTVERRDALILRTPVESSEYCVDALPAVALCPFLGGSDGLPDKSSEEPAGLCLWDLGKGTSELADHPAARLLREPCREASRTKQGSDPAPCVLGCELKESDAHRDRLRVLHERAVVRPERRLLEFKLRCRDATCRTDGRRDSTVESELHCTADGGLEEHPRNCVREGASRRVMLEEELSARLRPPRHPVVKDTCRKRILRRVPRTAHEPREGVARPLAGDSALGVLNGKVVGDLPDDRVVEAILERLGHHPSADVGSPHRRGLQLGEQRIGELLRNALHGVVPEFADPLPHECRGHLPPEFILHRLADTELREFGPELLRRTVDGKRRERPRRPLAASGCGELRRANTGGGIDAARGKELDHESGGRADNVADRRSPRTVSAVLLLRHIETGLHEVLVRHELPVLEFPQRLGHAPSVEDRPSDVGEEGEERNIRPLKIRDGIEEVTLPSTLRVLRHLEKTPSILSLHELVAGECTTKYAESSRFAVSEADTGGFGPFRRPLAHRVSVEDEWVTGPHERGGHRVITDRVGRSSHAAHVVHRLSNRFDRWDTEGLHSGHRSDIQ